ncbi:hypothetical protein [Alicyclobacillus sp. SO9]|uniref:hypothetical protein n=1 Tax=Alicyclobacillus sp. SO9 TaxID=2665646 RepID=UPI0018E881F3|nr:hypothetical protein [Alicyclobacillus sp. SO9]QQE77195.1 hypothetical protein GI364_14605 [Alicyclobacillus sp. SO9]
MCELLYLAKHSPFPLADVLPWAVSVEHFGIAGFGWGVSWVSPNGHLHHFVSAGTLEAEYKNQMKLAPKEAVSCLFHLRRPSFFKTLTPENGQPYLDPGRFAFAHNGFFQNHNEFRDQFKDNIQGESDSEIGFLLYQKYLNHMGTIDALEQVASELVGIGSANVMLLDSEGRGYALGRNRRRNRIFQLVGEGYFGAVTEMHSQDSELLHRVFPQFDITDEVTSAAEIRRK